MKAIVISNFGDATYFDTETKEVHYGSDKPVSLIKATDECTVYTENQVVNVPANSYVMMIRVWTDDAEKSTTHVVVISDKAEVYDIDEVMKCERGNKLGGPR